MRVLRHGLPINYSAIWALQILIPGLLRGIFFRTYSDLATEKRNISRDRLLCWPMWGLGLFLENESTQAMKEMRWVSASCSGATSVKFTLRASVVRIRYVGKKKMTYLTPETMRSQGSRGSPQPR